MIRKSLLKSGFKLLSEFQKNNKDLSIKEVDYFLRITPYCLLFDETGDATEIFLKFSDSVDFDLTTERQIFFLLLRKFLKSEIRMLRFYRKDDKENRLYLIIELIKILS